MYVYEYECMRHVLECALRREPVPSVLRKENLVRCMRERHHSSRDYIRHARGFIVHSYSRSRMYENKAGAHIFHIHTGMGKIVVYRGAFTFICVGRSALIHHGLIAESNPIERDRNGTVDAGKIDNATIHKAPVCSSGSRSGPPNALRFGI